VLADNLAVAGALTPGVYSFATGTPNLPASTTLTLNDPTGTGIFVFNVGASLTANVLSSVVGTANPCNIYWRINTDATLNGNNFWGTVITGRSTTLGAGANLTGRILAGVTDITGAVTMSGSGGNTIGGCSLNPPFVLGAVAPTVSKSFSPTAIQPGGTSTLTITPSNMSSNTVDTITTLTDNLPTGMVIASTPNASTTCAGGAVTASPGGNTVTMTGGAIPVANLTTATAGTCTVSVNVTAASAGSFINTLAAGALVTNNGNNLAPASATLTAAAATGVPTLSEWAMILLVALLAVTGFVTMRRQTR
jgi:hypothetical protein